MTETILQGKRIEELKELKLVGFRILCPGDQYASEIPKASNLLNNRLNELTHVKEPSVQIGAFVVENESDEEDGYWICVEVEEYGDIPNGMVALTVPSQTYAVIRHQGANYKIRDSYEDLHQWIEENQYSRQKNTWHIEKFYSWSDITEVDVELFDTINPIE